jgi:hypothetical protein
MKRQYALGRLNIIIALFFLQRGVSLVGTQATFCEYCLIRNGLPNLHLALYGEEVVFDHATKLVFTAVWVHLDVRTNHK